MAESAVSVVTEHHGRGYLIWSSTHGARAIQSKRRGIDRGTTRWQRDIADVRLPWKALPISGDALWQKVR